MNINPNHLKDWVLDIPDRELYRLAILDNDRVYLSSTGYWATAWGTAVSWEGLLDGELDLQVKQIFGEEILQEVKTSVLIYKNNMNV